MKRAYRLLEGRHDLGVHAPGAKRATLLGLAFVEQGAVHVVGTARSAEVPGRTTSINNSDTGKE